MKNKGIFICAGLFILSLIGISYYGEPAAYVLFLTALFIPVSALLYIFYVIQALRIYQETDGRDMVSGTPSDFYFTLSNEGRISFSSLRITLYSSFSEISGVDDGAEYELPPHSSIRKKTRLLCRYRGEYLVGIKKITVGDYLGLFSFTFNIREPLSVIVVPAILNLPETEGNELMAESDRDSIVNRTEPDIPLREYAAGDDLRLLNWKKSALMQKYMVREMKGEEKSRIAVIMDSGRYWEDGREYLPVENMVMEHSLSTALYYLDKNIPLDVIILTDFVKKISVFNTGDFDNLYREMCGFSFRKERDFAALSRELYSGSGLFGYRMLIFSLQVFSGKEKELIDRINTGRAPVRICAASLPDDSTAIPVFDGRTDVVMLKDRAKKEEGS